MKKKIYKWIENIDKDLVFKEFLVLITTIVLYLGSFILNVYQFIVIYLLTRIWIEYIIGQKIEHSILTS